MADPKGFLKTKRQKTSYREVCERVKDYQDVTVPRSVEDSETQASRCMDCGVPFCNWACPVGNYIPEWNDAIFGRHWEKAFTLLSATNNLPEITGRVCPAPCETACVLGINDEAITIRENELSLIEKAFDEGIIKPNPPGKRTGKRVAVVGSGPAGLTCAAQLNQAGHTVTVFERDKSIGGLMRYGIPDFKLEKSILDRRIALWKAEGIIFKTGVNVGVDMTKDELLKEFDAVALCGGSRLPRDLSIEGRELNGIHSAMDYLAQSNKRVSNESFTDAVIDAKGKKVVVIGGGDTGSDCVGTANRQGARCVVQIEVMPKPTECRTDAYPWPRYPLLLKTTSSHEEGSDRDWSVLTKKFIGENGLVTKLQCVCVAFPQTTEQGCPIMQEVPRSEFEIAADLVILAVGFVHPEHAGLLDDLGLAYDKRGNVAAGANYKTSCDKVFSAGDMRRGQSLIVWAIAEGRGCARHIDTFLMGDSSLPSF